MEGREKLYNGFGYLIYAVASADGSIQQSEINTLHKLIKTLFNEHNMKWPMSEGTFYLIHEEQLSYEKALDIGLSIIEENRYYFKEAAFSVLKTILYEVAKSFNSIEPDEFTALQDIYSKLVQLKND